MDKAKSLLSGIGNIKQTQKYYDSWSNHYDFTLDKWKYTAPKKSIIILKKKLKNYPHRILDLACGTGLFGVELKKIYRNSQIYGSDISKKSLKIANEKNIYKKLININFEKTFNYETKFELISMIGAMTYCKSFDKIFSNTKNYLKKKGHFIFSHRTDLWDKQNFDEVLRSLKLDFKINYISRPCNYLPLNNDFKNKIKIRLVLLEKY